MTEKVQVVVRIRPLPAPNSLLAVAPLDERRICVANRRVYHVDRVYSGDDSTELIFYQSVASLVDRFLAGYNTTVLAYGQTGTGKTYTMGGLTPLVVRYILENMSNSTEQLSFQCVEVYGETLRDLLANDVGCATKHLQLHDADGGGAVVVVGATRVKARNIAEVQGIIDYTSSMRTTGATTVNAHSSRSHSIFTIFNHERHSKLNLVDLAGSERNKKTHNVGQRFRESIAINGGLLALGNVIRALSRNHFQCPENPRHVPYRSSKLTRLLQDSLGGNSATLLIACVASDTPNSDETTRTLQYSALAMHILNEPLPQFEAQVAAAARTATGRAGSSSPSARDASGERSREVSPLCAAEVVRLQQRVVALEGQVQRCHEELRNDEAVFAKQIEDMRLLLEENELLKRRVAFLEGRPSATQGGKRDAGSGDWQKQPQKEQSQHPWKPELWEAGMNYVRDSLELRGISSQPNNRDAPSKPISLSHRVAREEGSAAMNQERPLLQQKSAHTLSDVAWRHEVAATAASAAGGPNMNKNHPSKSASGRGDGEVPLATREEQLGLLAKEALYYQKSNSELRQRLRSVLTMYEAQQREASMLRLELQQINELLDGTRHL